jgi:hypothetical protein
LLPQWLFMVDWLHSRLLFPVSTSRSRTALILIIPREAYKLKTSSPNLPPPNAISATCPDPGSTANRTPFLCRPAKSPHQPGYWWSEAARDIAWMTTNRSQGCERSRSLSSSGRYPGISLDGLRRTTTPQRRQFGMWLQSCSRLVRTLAEIHSCRGYLLLEDAASCQELATRHSP